jgi:arginine exporter protein ArgO
MMVSWQKVDELMQQEVSRKDFLRYVGIAFLSLIGVASMMQNLQKSLNVNEIGQKQKGKGLSGYGKSVYGR